MLPRELDCGLGKRPIRMGYLARLILPAILASTILLKSGLMDIGGVDCGEIRPGLSETITRAMLTASQSRPSKGISRTLYDLLSCAAETLHNLISYVGKFASFTAFHHGEKIT
jgi:hypothetical protein